MKTAWLSSLLLFAASSLAVADEGLRYKDQVIDYTVVSGDTLRGITVRTLGSDTFWEANWKLNPQVRDPDLLSIGQRLRIIAVREVIAERARVEQVVNRTEKRFESSSWLAAEVGDEISDGDAVRTRARSTAVLRFNASSVLRLGEFSQVFLARKETTLAGIDRGSVEITEGDVDVVFEKLSRRGTEIELISGASTVQTAPDAQGLGEIRAGKVESGGSRVMVYTGSSTVSAAGASVQVASGEGTRVPEKGPPAPPEKLLPAPQLDAADLVWNYSNGILRWAEVSRAKSYTLTLCRDAECADIVMRKTDLSQGWLQLDPQAVGIYYFRVLGVSASGLDGYISTAGRLQITDASPDLEAPMIAVTPAGRFFSGDQGKMVAGPDARLSLTVIDERSGVASVEWRWDDAPFAAHDAQEIALHPGTLQIRASDALGQQQLISYQVREDD